jgi:putative tricarboxylic transport membrane protein
LALIALAGLIAELLGGDKQEGDDGGMVWKKIILTVAALVAFAAIFEYAGYLVTTFLFVVFSLRVVEGRSWLQAGAVALSASLVSYIVFGLLLGAPLPSGHLGV